MIDPELFYQDPARAVGIHEEESLEDFLDPRIPDEGGAAFSSHPFYLWLVGYLTNEQRHFSINESPFIRPVLLQFAKVLWEYTNPPFGIGFDASQIAEKLRENASIPLISSLLNTYVLRGDWNYQCTQTLRLSALDQPFLALQETESFEEFESKARLSVQQACDLIGDRLAAKLEERVWHVRERLKNIPIEAWEAQLFEGGKKTSKSERTYFHEQILSLLNW